MPPDAAVVVFVRAALPPPPARVLEVGAGRGELAAALRDAGYDVVAIDPGIEDAPGVDRVALLDVEAGDASFDAAGAGGSPPPPRAPVPPGGGGPPRAPAPRPPPLGGGAHAPP